MGDAVRVGVERGIGDFGAVLGDEGNAVGVRVDAGFQQVGGQEIGIG
jgi:hypothetical protein